MDADFALRMIFLTTNEKNTHSLSNSYQMLPAGAYVRAKEFKGQLKRSVQIVREEECAVLKPIEQLIQLPIYSPQSFKSR